ncbi:MAG: enoyl-CoA hydratase/isomerase family protein [Candidatus Electryoneaceae bacterium]|nr:enoyl-CoA hydratase/isomerase family protein [Candidatus Electryoneaceae bacterium]
MADYKYIHFDCHDGRADLTFNRPPKNLLNVEMLEEILDALDQVRDDESLKILVLRGVGGTFCGGIETTELMADQVGLLMPLYTRMFDYLNSVHGLTLGEIKGDVLGGGCEIAGFCDVVIAADNARFGFPEITMGLFPPIATAVLPRLIGRSRTLDWIISGDIISSERALQFGLVARIVSEDKLNEEVERYADRVASLSAPAVTLAKRAVDSALYVPVMEAKRTTESTYMLDLMSSIDPHEGLKAIQEDRPPIWKNR